MSYNGYRPCIICGRTLANTWFPNKSAVCRCCRPKWEKAHPDRHWDPKKKCWLKEPRKEGE